MSKLKEDFYLREDVIQISKDLLGKYLVTNFDDQLTAGIITETEAYAGIVDKASHAYKNRRTKRTEIMFGRGGNAYVYLCYGLHHLFNVVTNVEDVPHAILVRAINPVDGIPLILARRNREKLDKTTSGGPGTVSQALGIRVDHSGKSLLSDEIWIEDRGLQIKDDEIITGPRVGVDYAEEDALLPYRFRVTI